MSPNDETPLTQKQIDYQAREKRVWDAVHLKKPDRGPIACYDE